MERLELNGDLEAQPRGVVAQLAPRFHGPFPLILGRDHLLLPDVFAQHQQKVLGCELVDKIQMRLGTLQVELAHRPIEIRNAQRAAAHADDRQAHFAAGVLDEPPFFDVDLEGIGRDIDGVKTDLPGPANAFRRAHGGTQPGGIDESEFHACASLISAGRTGRCSASER